MNSQSETQAPPSDVGADPKTSVVRVREHLIGPLIAAGLVKARSTRTDDHAAYLETLERRLSWMTAESLEALQQSVLELAGGERRNVWPKWSTVWNCARLIQHPPDERRELIVRWMRSEAGRRAWQASPWHAVALRRFLSAFGPARPGWATDRINRDAAQISTRYADLAGAALPREKAERAALEAERNAARRLVFPSEGS